LTRVHLTADDIAAVQVADAPDMGMELVLGAESLTVPRCSDRLAHWRTTVERRRHPGTSRLCELFTAAAFSGLFCQLVADDRLGTAEGIAAPAREDALGHLRAVAGARSLAPFTRGLTSGTPDAYTALGAAVADVQAVGIDPYRSQIESSVAASASGMASRMARTGVRGLFATLHPAIRWDGSTILVDASGDADHELEGRVLLVRPTALATKPMLSWNDPGSLVLHIPTDSPVLAAAAPRPGRSGLDNLLGSSRAAVLFAIVATPGLSNGRLAVATHLSDAAASRHAAALREAGLITTERIGMTVSHSATHLGLALAKRARTAAVQAVQAGP
jgi:DNA-binding transcriptional ArsR family regulator